MFELFVECAGLPVVMSSIESRPMPEPDILCRLRDGEWLTFELAELGDQHFKKGTGSMMQFRQLLSSILGQLPNAHRRAVTTRYADCRIDVTFIPGVSLRRHEAAIKAFYQWLASQPRLTGELTAELLPKAVSSAIPAVRISEPSPSLFIEPAFGMKVTEPDLSIFERKLTKRYVTSVPMELLLHSTLPLSCSWLETHSSTLREGAAMGPFQRVWVFSPTERTTDTAPVRFVHPPYPPNR